MHSCMNLFLHSAFESLHQFFTSLVQAFEATVEGLCEQQMIFLKNELSWANQDL